MPKPTIRQLSYLRSLAERTGQTFTYPTSRAEASAQIQRLKGVAPQPVGERRYERKLISDQVATGLNNTAVAADEVVGYGSDASWRHHRQAADRVISSPTVAARQAGPVVGKRTELARYTVAHGGERILYGQRVDGLVRFQPEETVVLDARPASSEDSECRPRGADEQEERADATRPKRPNDDAVDPATAEPGSERRGRTGPRVELGRYVISEGERALYGQRVWGVVRVTDVPLKAGGRAYLVDRGLEEDGNAALQALVADYLGQARRLGRCPLERAALLTDTRSTTLLAPAAAKDSPFAVMVKYGVNSWPEAIAARAAARRQAKALAAVAS